MYAPHDTLFRIYTPRLGGVAFQKEKKEWGGDGEDCVHRTLDIRKDILTPHQD